MQLRHPARDSSTLPLSLLLPPPFGAPSGAYTASVLPTFPLLTPTRFAMKSAETLQHLVHMVLVEGITVAAAPAVCVCVCGRRRGTWATFATPAAIFTTRLSDGTGTWTKPPTTCGCAPWY